MTQFITILIILFIFIGIGILNRLHKNWFPKSEEFRIREKIKGEIIFYRSEVYRKYFGWTPFFASSYNGNIYRDDSWSSYKDGCERNIETYKKLKPIK